MGLPMLIQPFGPLEASIILYGKEQLQPFGPLETSIILYGKEQLQHFAVVCSQNIMTFDHMIFVKFSERCVREDQKTQCIMGIIGTD